MEKRQIIQIAHSRAWDQTLEEIDSALFALCNDGTLWKHVFYELDGIKRFTWTRLTDIPQPLAQDEMAEIEELIKQEREQGLDDEKKHRLLYLVNQQALRN